MRTIRDNYYIITGHTYEEYCKKYRRGIGKGKLLSFTEEEAKYLKKNKFYWEVMGPDGKTLYCQVHRTVKPKYIIIPLAIVGLIGGGIYAGVRFIKPGVSPEPGPEPEPVFSGEVTEEEWKNALGETILLKLGNNFKCTMQEQTSTKLIDSRYEVADLTCEYRDGRESTGQAIIKDEYGYWKKKS